MKFKELNRIKESSEDKKMQASYKRFEDLIAALEKKEISEEVETAINSSIEKINQFTGPAKELRKRLKSSRNEILALVEKELKLVPKNHYLTRWIAIGMTAFGIPIGVAIGASSGNIGVFISVGIAVGMGVGVAIGSAKDKEALDAGRQLEISL